MRYQDYFFKIALGTKLVVVHNGMSCEAKYLILTKKLLTISLIDYHTKVNIHILLQLLY